MLSRVLTRIPSLSGRYFVRGVVVDYSLMFSFQANLDLTSNGMKPFGELSTADLGQDSKRLKGHEILNQLWGGQIGDDRLHIFVVPPLKLDGTY